MSNSLVKLHGQLGLLGITAEEKQFITLPSDKFCLELMAGEVTKLSGKPSLDSEPTTELESNSVYFISPATRIVPKRYHALIVPHINLAKHGLLCGSGQVILNAKQPFEGMIFRTTKKVLLKDIVNWFSLYMVD